MDIHDQGRLLVAQIRFRKELRIRSEGQSQCEVCQVPRAGTEPLICPNGCAHRLCVSHYREAKTVQDFRQWGASLN